MRTLHQFALSMFFAVAAVPPGSAAELAPLDRPIEQVVDLYVDALLKKENITPAGPADDATVIRRLTLDLAGRIPTTVETKAYVDSTDPRKKEQLVDRLMKSSAFVRHQAVMFEAMMLPANPRDYTGALRDYLQRALGENRSWRQIFQEIVTPNEADPKQKGASEYLKARVMDTDRLTIDVSVTFFGVNVSCAQCHDHPLVNDWKQDHFYGMKTFFSRTFASDGFIAEREYGTLKFKPNKGAEKEARPIFLTGKPIDLPNMREPTADEQKRDKQRTSKGKGKMKEGGTPPPPPAVSARAKLVEAALQEGNSSFFNRAIVNRMWHRFFGFGLVAPLDQMHTENAPSHPELLEWLARDTAAHQYDLRRLIRGIVLSRAYARSSKYPSADEPNPKFFAVARLKPLMPTQLATSLKIATTSPAAFANLKVDELEKKLDQLENSARGFATQIAMPADDFQIGVNEALLFSNSARIVQDFLGDAQGTLLGQVKEMKDRKQALATIVQTVLCRNASEDELQALAVYVGKRDDRLTDAYRNVIWAMIAGAEFRFSY
jgi:hypothetical protein